jgi:hypothetical protein
LYAFNAVIFAAVALELAPVAIAFALVALELIEDMAELSPEIVVALLFSSDDNVT